MDQHLPQLRFPRPYAQYEHEAYVPGTVLAGEKQGLDDILTLKTRTKARAQGLKASVSCRLQHSPGICLQKKKTFWSPHLPIAFFKTSFRCCLPLRRTRTHSLPKCGLIQLETRIVTQTTAKHPYHHQGSTSILVFRASSNSSM